MLSKSVIEELAGPVGAEEYYRSPDYAIPELERFITAIRDLSDDELYHASQKWIFDSALVSRFYRENFNHIHCRATVCFYEARRRHTNAGHDEDCLGDTIYSRAHRSIMQEHGYSTEDPSVCRCSHKRKSRKS